MAAFWERTAFICGWAEAVHRRAVKGRGGKIRQLRVLPGRIPVGPAGLEP